MRRAIKLVSAFFKKAFEYGFGIAFFDLLSRIFQKDFFYSRKHALILKWIDRHIGSNEGTSKTISDTDNKISEDAPIFIYWKQGFQNAPQIVKNCLQSVKNNAGKHPVIALCDANIDQYIKIPSSITEKLKQGKITIQTYSDIIRVLLLSSFGGIYLDSTIYIAKPFPSDLYKYELYSNKLCQTQTNVMYVSGARWSVFFLACGEDCSLLKKIRDLFLQYLNKYCKFGQIDYFFLDYLIQYLYSTDDYCKNIIDNIPFNNQGIYSLQKECDSMYNLDDFNKICKDTWLFKLDYRMFQHTDHIKLNSYRDRLLKNDIGGLRK